MNEESKSTDFCTTHINNGLTNNWCTNDLFICGKCQSQFKEIKHFLDHKSNFCNLNADYNNFKPHLNYTIKISGMNSEESKAIITYENKNDFNAYPNYSTGNYFSEQISEEGIEGFPNSTNINYIYNPNNQSKLNINSYTSFINDDKFEMEFPNEWNENCSSKTGYINELVLPNQRETLFDDTPNNGINFQLFPLSSEISNVYEIDNDGYVNNCNSSNILKANIGDIRYGAPYSENYPPIISSNNGTLMQNVDVDMSSSKSCMYNCESNKINYNEPTNSYSIINITPGKNDMEIANVDGDSYCKGFVGVDESANYNQLKIVKTGVCNLPPFKTKLFDISIPLVNETIDGFESDFIERSDKMLPNAVKDKNEKENSPAESQEVNNLKNMTSNNKNIKKYECSYCLKHFVRYSNLEQHIRLHTGEKPFQCPICGRKFTQKSNAKKHIRSHKVWTNGDNETLPKIHTIGVPLKDNRHIIIRPSKSLSSIVDRKKFHLLTNPKYKSFLGISSDNHNPIILVNHSFECKICKQRFQTYQKLRSHSIEHKDQQVYLCIFADCKQTFQELDDFLHHLEAHKKKENIKFSCSICGDISSTLYELTSHYNEHKNNGTNLKTNCQKCHKRVIRKYPNDLNNGKSVFEFSCSHCNKLFKSEKAFKSHVNHFSSNLQYDCPMCPDSFPTEPHLSRHVRLIHKSSTILFKCKQCDRPFRTMSSLKYHRIVHHKVTAHPDCKMAHCNKKSNINSGCECVQKIYKSSRRRKGISNNSGNVSVSESHQDPILKTNFDEDSMVCFCCGKLYRRRLPFESHVLMCKQKELEKERRENYRNQKFFNPNAAEIQQVKVIEDKSARRIKFKKTWKIKSTRRKIKSKLDTVTNEMAQINPKQTLPSISVLNKTYDKPLDSLSTNLNCYSFLKSLEFNP